MLVKLSKEQGDVCRAPEVDWLGGAGEGGVGAHMAVLTPVLAQILQESCTPPMLLGEARRANWAPGSPVRQDLSLSTLITSLKQATGVVRPPGQGC